MPCEDASTCVGYYANYNVVKKASEAAAEMAVAETPDPAAAVTPTTGPEPETEEMKLWKGDATTVDPATDTPTCTAAV
ncbi:hypothetical protein NP493_414g01017 [Ridgeia piscesae]|uniref:Uncharacterized protein n=1 Tax=Ridgeia piscesae TaxID=27915 RepID=A0AAD9L1V8_RIDPI|nr:hypothetical protein NP493_414g01017 [Ridgeia piscesae]